MKDHDLFLNMMANPEFSLQDFSDMGFTTDNTGLESKEYYKANSHVQKAFSTENGGFDEAKFNQAYDAVLSAYNLMDSINTNESLIKQARWDSDNILVEPSQRSQDSGIQFIQIPNPLKQQTGFITLGRTEEPTLSMDEIAQTQKVYDPETDSWHDSPNESFFTDFFDTRVMAQWDEDGTHIDSITGQEVKHVKGDLKYNENGLPYYENLAGRDIYGRRVLNKMNTLTTDGSVWNKYDFFDSDDREQKSVGGTIMKNLALVGSMFIPTVGPVIAGISIATQAAGFLSTLGKMFVGSDSPTLSAIEGWAKSVDRQSAKTEYSQQHTWTWENFIGLIGDVAGQLKEQRMIFQYAPAIFKGRLGMGDEKVQKAAIDKWTKEYQEQTIANLDNILNTKSAELMSKGKSAITNKAKVIQENLLANAHKAQNKLNSYMKSYRTLGSSISKGYMTAVTVEDTYGEAKQAGATDMEAALLTMGYAAGELWILNTAIGERILPELKAGAYENRTIVDALYDLRNTANKVAQSSTKGDKINWVKKAFNAGKNLAIGQYTTGSKIAPAIFSHALGEGVEETSEELLADFSKACFNITQWLQGDDTRMSAFENIADRYGMSFLGGMVGGGINTPFKYYKSLSNDLTYNQAVQKLIYKVRNGEINDFYKTLDKVDLASKNLSSRIASDENGVIIFEQANDYKDSQDYQAKQQVRTVVNNIQNLLNAEGSNISDESFLNNLIGDLRYNTLNQSIVAGAYLQDFNSINASILDTIEQINALETPKTDQQKRQEKVREETNSETGNDDINKTKRKELEKKLKELRERKDKMLDGSLTPQYIQDSLFEMLYTLNNIFTKPTFIQYAEAIEKKPLKDIPESRLNSIKTEYLNWKNTDAKDQIRMMSDIFKDTLVKLSPVLKAWEKNYKEQYLKSEGINLVNYLNLSYEQLINQSNLDSDKWLNEVQNTILDINNSLAFSIIDYKTIAPYLDQIKEIKDNKQLSEKEKQDLISEQVDNMQGVLANELPKAVQKFINQGYINQELKELLIPQLKAAQKYAALKNIKYLESLDNPMDMSSPWMSVIQNLADSLYKLTNLNATPIEQQLEDVSIALTGKPINIRELITKINEIFNDTKQDVTQFNISEELGDQIDEAISIISLYRAAVNATKTDNLGFVSNRNELGQNVETANLWGYTKTLNELNKKYQIKDWQELAELDSDAANSFIADLDILANKLIFYKKLYNTNQGQKLNRQNRVATNATYLFYNKLSKFITTIPDGWEGREQLKALLESLSFLKENAPKKILNLSSDNQEKLEQEKLKLEDGIYDFFQLNSSKLNDPNGLIELLNPKTLNILKPISELLDEDTEEIDDNSFVWWLASRAAVKSSDFYSRYKQIINTDLAPIPTQELSEYLNYAFIVNGNVFTKFYNTLRDSILKYWKELSPEDRKKVSKDNNINPLLTEDKFIDYIFNSGYVPLYQNIMLTEGGPGTGKTQAVFKTTVRLLQAFHPELLNNVIIAHGASKEGAESIKNSLNLITAQASDRENLMKTISPDWKEYSKDTNGLYQIGESDYYINDNKEVKSKFGIVATNTPPSLILIDEISKFTAFDLDTIDQYAKKYGIPVLVAGDFDQSGITGSYTQNLEGSNVSIDMELSRNEFIRAPKLGVSMRTGSNQKNANIVSFLTLFRNNFKGDLTLRYYQDTNTLTGDKLYNTIGTNIDPSDLASIEKDIEQMIKLKSPEGKIGYIYYNTDTDLYKLLSNSKYKDHIKFYFGGTAQGFESDFYIVENDPNVSKEVYFHDLYTGVTRSKKASLVFAPVQVGNSKILPKVDSSTIQESFSAEGIKKYAENRKQLLNKLITTTNDIPYIPRDKEDSIQPIADQQPSSPINPTLPKSEPTQTTTQKENQSSEEETQSLPEATTDIIPEETYKTMLDNSSQSDPILPEVDKKTSSLNMLLYSFNTYETGLSADSSGNIDISNVDPQRLKARIDSLFGIVNMYTNLNLPIPNYDQGVTILGALRALLLSGTSREAITTTASFILPVKNMQLTFVLKSSAAPSRGNKYGTNNPNYYKFDKSTDEQLSFIYSNDSRSKEVGRRHIVAIFSDEKGNNLLELPLLTLTSPLTFINLQQNGEYVFPNAKQIYDNTPGTIGNKLEAIEKLLGNYPDESTLLNLVKLFRLTKNLIFDMDSVFGSEWTPSNTFEQLGIQFNTQKGIITDADGFNYDADWIDISTLAENKSLIISPILTSKTSKFEGYPEDIVNAGHPFVLITQNPDIANLGDYYVKQFTEPETHPKQVKLVYVLPPKATISEFIENKYFIINNKGANAKPIGNIFSSYHILKELIQHPDFEPTFSSLIGDKAIQKVKNQIEALNNMSQKEQAAALKAYSDWSDVGFLQDQTLTRQLDNFLKSLVYVATNNVLSPSEIQYRAQNMEAINKMLEGKIDGVYYATQIPATEQQQYSGPFIIAVQQNYSIYNKPYQIHGKVDSVAFRGDLSGFIADAINNQLKIGTTSSGVTYYTTKATSQYLNGTTSSVTPKDLSPVQKLIKQVESYNITNHNINETDSLEEALTKAANYINNSSIERIAFIIGDKLIVSQPQTEFLVPIVPNYLEGNEIKDANGNTTFNLAYYPKTLSGSYVFKFQGTTSDFNAELRINDQQVELILTPIMPEPQGTNTSLDINELNFEDYKNVLPQARTFATLRGSATIEQFMDTLEARKSGNKEMILKKLGEELQNYDSGSSYYQILQNLINYINGEQIDNITCPTPITIKF